VLAPNGRGQPASGAQKGGMMNKHDEAAQNSNRIGGG
jgi:hypothetical protein